MDLRIFAKLVAVAGVLLVGCSEKHEQSVSIEQPTAKKWGVLQRPPEPSFDGRLLSAWLEILGRPGPWQVNSNWSQEDYTAASNAIFNLGGKAVPFLRYALTANENKQGAVAACRLLGPEAKPAVPELVAWLRAGGKYAAYALMEVDPTAISLITESFTNQNSEVRYESIIALSLRPGTEIDITKARPAVLKCLEDDNELVRSAATNLIRQMGGKPPWTEPPEGSAPQF